MDDILLGVAIVVLFGPTLLAEDIEKLTENPRIVEMNQIAQEKRLQNGKSELELDEECCQIAQEWANYMAENRKFHHGKKEQIIAYGYRDANAAFRGWMNSRGHRRWMLSNSKKCGWGCQQSEKGTWYWVGVFR